MPETVLSFIKIISFHLDHNNYEVATVFPHITNKKTEKLRHRKVRYVSWDHLSGKPASSTHSGMQSKQIRVGAGGWREMQKHEDCL